jgi:PAS domain S-box-containing protein
LWVVLAWVVLAAGLLLTLGAWSVARTTLEETRLERLRFHQAEVTAALGDRISTYEQILYGARALLRASEEVSRQEWRTYVGGLGLATRYPGIQGLGFAPWVLPADVPALEAQMRAEGHPGFRIWPAEGGEPRVPIVLLEPFEGRNLRAFGFDMASQEMRRRAILLARDSGTATITGKVRLVQETETDIQSGFLIFLPYYDRPWPETLEQRRQQIRGFVYAPFRVGDFMTTLAESLLGQVRLRIFDGPAETPDALIYDSDPERPPPAPAGRPQAGGPAGSGAGAVVDAVADAGGVVAGVVAGADTSRVSLTLPGTVWTLRFQPEPGFGTPDSHWLPEGILAVGGMLSGLSFAAIRSAGGLRREQARTASLGRVVEEAATEIYLADVRSLSILQANRGARSNLGYTAEEMRGLRLTDIQKEMTRAGFADLARALQRDGLDQVSYVTRHRRRDGSSYEAEVTLQQHPSWAPPIYLALVHDVTEERRRQEAVRSALAEARTLLAEKETLLREVHHRVKNNLQVIWSLIRLEAADIPDPAIRARLEVVARRISVLGQIHQQLYASENLARVDIGLNIRQLADNLAELYARPTVTINVMAEAMICDLDAAIPLGLIANELISNSLEHAFPDGRAGHVALTLAHDDHEATVLSVTDDGVGIPVAEAGRTGLGLRLVEALASQLGATVERLDSPEGGTTIRIIIAHDILPCA